MTRAEYERILQFLRQATEHWTTHAYTCSAYTGEGIMDFWQNVVKVFMKQGFANGVLKERRKQQTISWVYTMIEEHLHNLFYRCPEIIKSKGEIEEDVINGKLSATLAVQQLIDNFANADINENSLRNLSPFDLK